MPSVEEVGDGIMRVNSGHDSNIEKEKVIRKTKKYKKRFFNTSIPRFDFPDPVVFTANHKEEDEFISPSSIPNYIDRLMFVRLRVSSTNLHLIDAAVEIWTSKGIPVVLTFMAYYSEKPPTEVYYEWRKRHVNSYWCPTKRFIYYVLEREKKIGGRLVTICGTLNSNKCADCGNCANYYYITKKHMDET
jgi:hypothetical protein